MENAADEKVRARVYANARTGTYCDKHSLLVKKNKRGEYTEIIPFDSELGVYRGPETEIMNGKTGTYCIQCRKEEKVFAKVSEFQKEAKTSIAESKRLAEIKRTSAVLKKQSVITDETIEKANFDNFKVVDDGTKRIKLRGVEIAKEILGGSKNTYVFAGPTGRGKSHISMAILNYVNANSYVRSSEALDNKLKPFKCVYISIPKLITLINETNNMSWAEKENYKFTDAKMKELIASSDVVVLDDIGAEVGALNNNQKATNSQIRLLTELLNSRQGKATIISTNLVKDEIKQVYDERVESRMNESVVGLGFKDTFDKRGGI